VLLLLRDSFSLAMLPFLEGHFSRIVIAHNEDGFWRPDLVERFRPDVVISEVIESGAPYIMAGSPPPSEAARARIAHALALPHRLSATVTPRPPQLPTNHIDGGPGDDHLRGGRGGDIIRGYAGNDTVEGLDGDDVLRGGRGDDKVSGGDGRDWISGDRGDDILSGGRGADVFRLAPDFGNDLVTDFSIAEGDRVELPPGVAYTLRQQGADTVLELSGGRLTLRGVRAADLPSGWIVFR
jgi:Ca2+-binding RTX toxin-like protein